LDDPSLRISNQEATFAFSTSWFEPCATTVSPYYRASPNPFLFSTGDLVCGNQEIVEQIVQTVEKVNEDAKRNSRFNLFALVGLPLLGAAFTLTIMKIRGK